MKLGFIGCGNMAGAIMGGIVKNNICTPGEIAVYDLSPEAMDRVQKEYGVERAESNSALAGWAEALFLAVKPQFYGEVIGEIRNHISPETLVITIAPGKTLAWLREEFQNPVQLIRTMPNTPALVGEGITAVTPAEDVPQERVGLALRLLEGFGQAEIIPERLMDAVVAVSGSSPAYVYMMIEAMADEAVALGMPRPQAYTFAAQAVLGSARMVLETGKHPGELKDMVCSPGGTTILAVEKLEETGFRSSLMQAMRACAEKAASL